MSEARQGHWRLDGQGGRCAIVRRAKQRLTLGDVIKVVSQFSRDDDDNEIFIVVTDLINHGPIRLQVPYRHTGLFVRITNLCVGREFRPRH
jgi:hypothetical protein